MSNEMRIALIADAFPPLRTSTAVQLRDLTIELRRQGHTPTMIVAAPYIDKAWILEENDGVQVLRLKTPRTKDIGYIRRAINELLMPWYMRQNYLKSPFANIKWEGIIWYAPSIFLGFVANFLKKKSGCHSYLILRDIFPEWAVDMGLLKRGMAYRFFKRIERYQYSVATVIGVQTHGCLSYFKNWNFQSSKRIEVLQNWLAPSKDTGCTINVASGLLAGRKIFVYAGNMGIAQDLSLFIDLASNLRSRIDVGFLFVGRGSNAPELKEDVKKRGLDNILFCEEVDPSEISGLYAQCHIGIVALDPRHRTQNIPGKFLSYMQSGLPVLASINPGNDLVELITVEKVGRVCTDQSLHTLQRLAEDLLIEIDRQQDIATRCRALFSRLFLPETAARQIIAGLK